MVYGFRAFGFRGETNSLSCMTLTLPHWLVALAKWLALALDV